MSVLHRGAPVVPSIPALYPLPASSVRSGGCPSVLTQIADPVLQLVCGERELPEGLSAALFDWVISKEEGVERLLSSAEDEAATRDALAALLHGLPERHRLWLERDIVSLLRIFRDIAPRTQVRFFFGPVRSDRCRKFHADYVDHRLICTYLGPGTEWVPSEWVNRAALRNPPARFEEANAAIVPDSAAVQHARAGEVLLMKGEKSAPGRGLVHRSPPVEAKNATRVVLILSTESTNDGCEL